MNRLVSPLALVLILSLLSFGWRSSASMDPPDGLISPVNMTLAENRLYVSDPHSGLHVYDVTDLTAPAKVVQIPLRANYGSAVRDDIVYTNSYSQLQAIRITGDTWEVLAKIGEEYPDYGWDESGGFDESGFSCACTTTDYATGPQSAPDGGGSSYATFALIDDHLYRVHRSDLIVYDVSNVEKPRRLNTVPVGWDIETIYPTPNFLFVGGVLGMYIFDRVDPAQPVQIGQIQHARACDPVVVHGSTAYVTLRGSSACGASPDELLCVSIKDPAHPKVVGQKLITTPYGLAVQNERLYVSHGTGGYSLLNVSDPRNAAIEKTWSTDSTRDFIWSGHTLFVLNERHVSIYDVTDPLEPRLLSRVGTSETS